MSSFWGDGSPVVSAPAIIRGTVSLGSSGVISGKGLTSDARIANGAAIQAAINRAISNNKFFEAPPGDYEIDLAGGLVVDAEGFVWIGSINTKLTQFASNTPVITLGNAVSTGNGSKAMSIFGLTALYGVDQTGNTNANAIVMGSSWQCRYEQIRGADRIGYFKPYRSIYFKSIGTDQWFFSNAMRDCGFGHAQQEIWRHSLMSTGCVYQNIYIGGGNPNITAYPTTSTIGVVSFNTGGIRGADSVFEQFNIEWVSGNHILYLYNARQYVFDSLHIEGCALAGDHPSFLYLDYSEVQGAGWTFENCRIPTGLTGGTPEIFGGYGPSKVTVDGLRLGWLTLAGADTNVASAYNMMNFGGERVGYSSRVTLRNMYIEGGGTYGGNTLIPSGDAPYPTSAAGGERTAGGNYIYDGNEQYFENPGYVIDNDFTVYGSIRNPSIRYPASCAANRTLILSDKLGSSGWQATAKVRSGAMVHLYRQNGTAANTVTVKNLTSGGTTLATSSTADVHYRFQFDGTNWAKVQ